MHTLEFEGRKFPIQDEVSGLIIAISKERDELKDLAIWMTGCGYDFCQHEYFNKKRDELLLTPLTNEGIEPPFEHVTDGEERPCGPDTETYEYGGAIVPKR